MNPDAKPILVIGGGIAGITAALEAAEVGYRVILAEQEAYLGGRVTRMHQYFPKMCPPACGMEINTRRIRENPPPNQPGKIVPYDLDQNQLNRLR